MNAAVWGMLTAFGWGSADFIAYFTGRAIGHQVALFAMLSVGVVLLTFIVWLMKVPLVWDPCGFWLLVCTGIGIMAATMLLYWGLARGPVTVVAPLVGSYPAFSLVLAVLLGARPGVTQWFAMAVVILGVIVVARNAKVATSEPDHDPEELRRTIFIALCSSLAFALTFAAAQQAKLIYGELQTVCVARWISLLSCGILLAWSRKLPRIPIRWWPMLGLQGLLDSGAYMTLLAGTQDARSVVVVVVASSFSAVTVLLARLILRERMAATQWFGIAMIIFGVGALSAY